MLYYKGGFKMEDFNEMIGVGDFITADGMEGYLYVVTDVYDYSDENDIDIIYNAIRIFPVRLQHHEQELDYREVTLHSKFNSKQYIATYNAIKSYRLEKNLKAEPEFMSDFDVVERDVDYSSGLTVDDCLDMINNLDFLYKAFGDKEYKDNKALVMKRIEELVKEDKKKKK